MARSRLLWIAAGLVGLAELAVAGLVLMPRAGPVYRAYFIAKISDCWPHQTDGHYTLGTTLWFATGHSPDFTPNKICGWFYPSAEGDWSYGDYSLLLLVFPPVETPLTLTLTATAMTTPAHPIQRVIVTANGATLGTVNFEGGAPQTKTLNVPAAIAGNGGMQLRFIYLDARPGTELGPNEDAHLRAIRMVSLTLAPTK
jgi:hypothetical protein